MLEQPSQDIFATGKLFELVHSTQPDGRLFETARRAPGVRLIIDDAVAGKLLLTREYRAELKGWDHRLPGGKVFDTLADYEAHRTSGVDILEPATAKAKAECLEEAGIIADELEFYRKSTLGATVEWDLYIFSVTKWRHNQTGQQLEHGEQIETDNWYDYAEVKDMILQEKTQEERVALWLLRWLVQNNKISI